MCPRLDVSDKTGKKPQDMSDINETTARYVRQRYIDISDNNYFCFCRCFPEKRTREWAYYCTSHFRKKITPAMQSVNVEKQLTKGVTLRIQCGYNGYTALVQTIRPLA